MSLINQSTKNDCLAYIYATLAQIIFPFSFIYAIERNFSMF